MQTVLAMSDVAENIMIIGGLIMGGLFVAGWFYFDHLESRDREQSRREIAAYIAEGSMTIEQGERLMNAGEEKKKS